MSEVTRILSAIEQGDPSAAELLLPLVYDELRKLATERMAQEKPGQTLQATALVHEAYLRLVDGEKAPHWNSRAHFFGAAAEAMRRILIENARRKKADKHGGASCKVDLEEAEFAASSTPETMSQLSDALDVLAREDSAVAQVAKLRLFAGMSATEAAEILGLSRATAFRHWTYARAWLAAQMRETEDS
jgi:RNA polymerase sigma factor (TIGR02999 family)